MSVAGIRRRYAFLYALRWFGTGFIVPVLVLLAAARGLSVAEIGIAFLPFGLVTALLELPTGGLADSIGRRPVLIAAAIVQVAGLVAWGLARSTLAFALAGALMGVSRALDSGPLEAWFVDATHDAGGTGDDSVRRGLALGSVAESLALGVGSLVGGFLPRVFDALPQGPGAVVVPLSVPFLVAAVLSALHAGALVALMTEAPRGAASEDDRLPTLGGAVREGLRIASRVRPARRLLYGFAAFYVLLTTAEVLWPPRVADILDRSGVGASGVLGALFAAAFAAAALGAALAPRAATALGGDATRTLRVWQLACAGALTLMAATRDPVVSMVAFLGVYGAVGVFGTLQRELLHDCVGRNARSVLLSVSSLVGQAGSVATKLTLLPLAARAGIPAAWAATAGLLAITAALYTRVDRGPAARREGADDAPSLVTSPRAG